MLLKLAGIGNSSAPRVLKNISFEVHPGTVTLLVGANGAGKTTLLKIMAGPWPAPPWAPSNGLRRWRARLPWARHVHLSRA